MTERERLIQLLQSSHCVELWNHNTDDFIEPNPIEKLANYLLANGVIVPPCKVGDYVYYIKGGYYREPRFCEVSRPCKVVEISFKRQRGCGAVMRGFITDNGTRYSFDGIGKTVFRTREEAEKALERSRG